MTKLVAPRRTLIAVAVLFFTALTLLLMSAGRDGKIQQVAVAEVPRVDVIPAVPQTSYLREVTLVGRVESAHFAVLGFELSGQIAEVLVDEGEEVAAGQVLATLDTARLQAQSAELTATLARATAEETLANISLKRISDLVSKGVESAQRLDEAKANFQATRASVAQAQAALARVEVELQKSQLRAPFAGLVVARRSDVGSFVNAGAAVLELQQSDSMRIRVSVPPDHTALLDIGQQYLFQNAGVAVNTSLTAVVKSRQLSTQTLEALFTPSSPHELIAGQIVTLALAQERQATGSWVPLSALGSGVRGTWTVLVTAGEGLQELTARAVTLIYTDGRQAFVSGALDENDYIVVTGTQRLVNRQRVDAQLLSRRIEE